MSEYLYLAVPNDASFSHSGVKGMHWYVRRYQNDDGTLTPLGKIHYAKSKEDRQAAKDAYRRQKNLSVGKERLKNRIERANNLEDLDRLSVKAGWKNTVKAGEGQKRIESIKDISMEILKSQKRTEALGQGTRNRKYAAITGMTLSGIMGAGGAANHCSYGISCCFNDNTSCRSWSRCYCRFPVSETSEVLKRR